MNSNDELSHQPIDAAKLSASDVNTALVHFYRGEVSRSNTWRQRLDATTNWAVVTCGASLSFAFSASGNTHLVILISTLLVLLFLFIEARRYRYYELWTHRVRLMETNYFAPLMSPSTEFRQGWAERIVHSLRRPRFPISLLEALGRRYRRNYAPIFLILAAAWIAKVVIHPTPVADWQGFVERASMAGMSGWVTLGVGLIFNALLIALGLFTTGLRESSGEVLGSAPRGFRRLLALTRAATREALDVDMKPLKMPLFERGRQLVYIISDENEAIAKPLMKQLDRGVTSIRGTGMYSGKEHAILLCVVTGRQLDGLKKIVQEHDPHAFVIVTAARDVRGEGFRPLEA